MTSSIRPSTIVWSLKRGVERNVKYCYTRLRCRIPAWNICYNLVFIILVVKNVGFSLQINTLIWLHFTIWILRSRLPRCRDLKAEQSCSLACLQSRTFLLDFLVHTILRRLHADENPSKTWIKPLILGSDLSISILSFTSPKNNYLRRLLYLSLEIGVEERLGLLKDPRDL